MGDGLQYEEMIPIKEKRRRTGFQGLRNHDRKQCLTLSRRRSERKQLDAAIEKDIKGQGRPSITLPLKRTLTSNGSVLETFMWVTSSVTLRKDISLKPPNPYIYVICVIYSWRNP